MNPDLLSLLGTKVTSSVVIIYLINWVKQSKWAPAINYESAKLNHWLAVALTGLGTLGIGFTYSAHDHTLLITGLVWGTIAHGVWEWITNYTMTKVGYSVLKDKLPGVPVDVSHPLPEEEISSRSQQ